MILVVGGCSNTAGVGFPDYRPPSPEGEKQSTMAWPSVLGNLIGDVDVHNIAIGGSSNGRITRQIIEYIEKLKQDGTDLSTVRVGVMWTTPVRYELLFDEKDEIRNLGPWESVVKNNVLTRTCKKFIEEMLAIPPMHSYDALSKMHYLQEYLVNNSIDYFFTVSGFPTLWTVDYKGNSKHLTDIEHCQTFKSLIDWSKFVYVDQTNTGMYFKESSGLVDLGYKKEYPMFECGHFGEETHQEFVKEHLFPVLQKNGFI